TSGGSGSGSTSTTTTTPAPRSPSPTEGSSGGTTTTTPATGTTPATTTTPVPPSPTTPNPIISGKYGGTVGVVSDPAGHSCCVHPASSWDVYQGRAGDDIFIRLSDILPGITLQQDIPATGTQFTATSIG